MPDGIFYCLNLNWATHFRVEYRNSVTFKTKLYIKTVNNSFQPLAIFGHKDLHLWYCTGLELNTATFTKILKGIGGGIPMTEYNLGKIWKTDPPRRPKKCISRGFLHEVLSNGLNRVNTNSLTYVDCVAIINISAVYLAKTHYHLISSNTTQFGKN